MLASGEASCLLERISYVTDGASTGRFDENRRGRQGCGGPMNVRVLSAFVPFLPSSLWAAWRLRRLA